MVGAFIARQNVLNLNWGVNMTQMHTKQSIATFTGKFIEPLNPQWDDLDIIDIAHGLSNICRYGGQSLEFYSVSQHSVYVSYNTDLGNELNGLLHDGSEAYLGDVPRPIKHTTQYQFYRDVEDVLQTMIFQKFGSTSTEEEYETPDIKYADNSILMIEQQHLFKKPWNGPKLLWSDLKYKDEFLLDVFKPWTPRIAETRFMERFVELTGGVE